MSAPVTPTAIEDPVGRRSVPASAPERLGLCPEVGGWSGRDLLERIGQADGGAGVVRLRLDPPSGGD